MTTAQFLEEFQDVLQREGSITLDSVLSDMEEWDSLAVMACIAYLDKKFKVKTTFKDFKPLQTVADIVALTKGAVA